MDVYMLVVADEIEEVKAEVVETVSQALDDEKLRGELINECSSDAPDEWRIGIQVSLNKKKFLQEPLNFLNSVAKQHKIDFVVGFIENGEAEDICYFGHHEGKPDLFEVGTYLGLK